MSDIPDRPSKQFETIYDPAWALVRTTNCGMVLQVYHPVHGWLAFSFKPDERETLARGMLTPERDASLRTH